MPEKSDATRRLTMSCSEDSEVLSIETGRDEQRVIDNGGTFVE